MQEAGENKDHCACEIDAIAASDEWRINVPTHEVIDGFIPCSPISAHAGTVPPVGIELSIAEAHNFRQGVKGGLEDCEEACKPNDEGDSGEFHEAFEDGREVHCLELVEGVAEDGGGVLGAGDPYEHAQAEGFREAFGDEEVADGRAAGVDGLIDQGRGPPEVGEVADCYVLRVRALGVEVREGRRWLLGKKVGVAEIAVCEGVGAVFEPDDHDVELADGPD